IDRGMIQDGKLRGFAMGHAIPVRTDYAAGEVRRFAQRAKDAAQARRLLAIAAVLDGASREEAAKIGGMDRQTLRDWVIRFNEQGADGLINIPSPGMPPKLNAIHKAFLARIVEEGPIAAIHGVVRWRACDLIMRVHEEFGLSVSDDTIYRALKTLGFLHVNARPKAYRQKAQAHDPFTKNSPDRGRKGPNGAKQHLALAAPATATRTQRPRKYLAIHAAELVVEPNFPILRRYRRSLLLRLEHAHRSAVENHVHRPPRLGSRRSLNLRIGIICRAPGRPKALCRVPFPVFLP